MVAQELEPLIAMARAAAGQRQNMSKRAFEQIAVLEAITDGLFQRACSDAALAGRRGSWRVGGRRRRAGAFVWLRRRFLSVWLGVRFGRALHRTIVNSRLQRTENGQRHTSHARSPSCTEKKMIWARPTMFSNGT